MNGGNLTGGVMSGKRAPVEDFATDFDHTDPTWVADPYAIWADLRGRCPVAHTDRYGGAWLPVRHAEVAAVAYDTEHFTSRSVVMSEVRPGPHDLPAPIGLAPPITSDPPFHALARRMLLPAFSPKAVAAYEPYSRRLCRELLDAVDGADEVDASVDFARHIPLRVIVRMLGFPEEDADVFRTFITGVLEDVDESAEERQARADEAVMEQYMDARIAEHLAEPRDDLTSFLLEAELDGHKLQTDHVRGTMVLLLIAGIDTTWSAIGSSLWHLATHPEDRRRLAADPALMDTAVEELLRAYAPVTMARLVAKDVELGGRQLKEGDWLLLPFPAANRDPAMFPDADRVVLDRQVNRHAAFGLGIHRCLGSNLARMELRVALEEWLARFPDFELADPDRITWSAGQIRGPRVLPLRILR
ncbi:cytochrome P450 [Acidimicrobiaceae bacterium USS-CC1]|uniref:Cytochrome P450 n=1 Tax=Acidiferrimicrobium australe TaxID=2664430 RepID=A0ABW9QNF7_9ACTN|nr:cytochrome P450 [Acidiferrimicrobium australe]